MSNKRQKVDDGIEKKYKCEWPECGYASNNSSHMTIHRRIHTGIKPFVCDWAECTYKCTASSSLMRHKRRIHIKDRPYACDWPNCQYKAIESSDLIIHKRIHSKSKPYVCDWVGCQHACTNSSDLTSHKKMHSKIKPYICIWPNCSYKTSYSNALTIHRRIHMGCKPYKCNVNGCNYVSSNCSHLTRHKRIHTNEGIQRQKRKENIWVNYMKTHLSHTMTFDREVQVMYNCIDASKKFSKLDLIGILHTHPHIAWAFELDESQHKDYEISCELARMLDTSVSIQMTQPDVKHIVWCRINPDGFKIDDKTYRICKKDRYKNVCDFVTRYNPKNPIEVAYFYYDMNTNDNGDLQPCIWQDKEYDANFKSLCIPMNLLNMQLKLTTAPYNPKDEMSDDECEDDIMSESSYSSQDDALSDC